MYFHFSRAFLIVRILTGITLLTLITGCGKNTITIRPTITPSTSASVGGTSSPPASLISLNPGGVFNLGGILNINTDWGGPITCTVDYDVNTNIVLATNRLTYDTVEIQKMAGVFTQGGGVDLRVPLPSTFERVSGDTAGLDIPSWGDINHGFVNEETGGCSGAWSITNIGKSLVQITQVEVQLSVASQVNNYHYRLIDVCSLPGIPDSYGYCEHSQGAGAEEHKYIFHLKPGSKNSIFQGQATNQFSLNPGETADVGFVFLPTDASSYQIYSFIPRFIINTVDGQISLSIPQLTSTVSFVPSSQLSCYQLHGNTFAPLDIRGSNAYADSGKVETKVLCI